MKLETFGISAIKQVVMEAIKTFHVESAFRGYHAYKNIWMPNSGDTFDVKIKKQNSHDRYMYMYMHNIHISYRHRHTII